MEFNLPCNFLEENLLSIFRESFWKVLSDFQKEDENRVLCVSHPVCGHSGSIKCHSWMCALSEGWGVGDRTKPVRAYGIRGGGHDRRVELCRRRQEGLAGPLQARVSTFSRAVRLSTDPCKETGKSKSPFLSRRHLDA